MPSIFKRFMKPAAKPYQFAEMLDENAGEGYVFGENEGDFSEDLLGNGDGEFIETDLFGRPAASQAEAAEADSDYNEEDDRPLTPVDYARVQAEAILATANLDAEKIKERAKAEALAEAAAELAELKEQAKAEGYEQGYAEGMAQAREDGRLERERQAVEQAEAVDRFLESAAHAKELVINQAEAEMRDLALTIAEKVIRVSLKSSSDILLRMIETATEKHRRCEWVQIYIADCDARKLSLTAPEMAAALRHLSDRVRIIPMADDESGTCIIEMPDEILDASVSTQMENIREIVNQNVGIDSE